MVRIVLLKITLQEKVDLIIFTLPVYDVVYYSLQELEHLPLRWELESQLPVESG